MFDAFIRFQARHRPHAAALVQPGGEISFRKLDGMVDRVGAALSQAGAAEARLAAVRFADPVLSWVMLLALARLGVGSVTFGHETDAAALETAGVDLLIVEEPGPAALLPAVKRVAVSQAWLSACLQAPAPPLPPPQLDPQAIARLTLSSGTTGTRKIIARTWAELRTSVSQRQVVSAAMRLGHHGIKERVLSMFGLDTVVFYHLLAIWAGGGAVAMAGWNIFREEGGLEGLAPTMLLASPAQLQGIVDGLPPEAAPLPGMVIVTGGSHLPSPLREAVRRQLSPTIWNVYASSEVDVMAMAEVGRLTDQADAAGWAPPAVEVEVVNEAGATLPVGQDGAIRVRSPGMVQAYLGDAAATANQFKQGWFYPGDVGCLEGDGRLRVKGRLNEVMNFGGVKLLPGLMEEAARTCPGVRDVAAFSARDGSGGETPWLAIVRGDGFAEAAMVDALAPLKLPPVRLAWMTEIPRNARGKIERTRLREAAERG